MGLQDEWCSRVIVKFALCITELSTTNGVENKHQTMDVISPDKSPMSIVLLDAVINCITMGSFLRKENATLYANEEISSRLRYSQIPKSDKHVFVSFADVSDYSDERHEIMIRDCCV